VSSSGLDLQELAQWCSLEPQTAGFAALAGQANTARQVLQDSGSDPALISLVCGRTKEAAARMAAGIELGIMLIGYDAEVLYYG
jgi:cobalt-precorrin-5B (C1)-methyltransferase